MPQNIKFDDLLGKDFKEANYMVSTNWRIDFTKSAELRNIMGGNDNVLKQTVANKVYNHALFWRDNRCLHSDIADR